MSQNKINGCLLYNKINYYVIISFFKKERVGSQVPVLPSTAKQFPHCTSTERRWSRKSNAKQWIILLKLIYYILLHEIEGSMDCTSVWIIHVLPEPKVRVMHPQTSTMIFPYCPLSQAVYYNRSVCWQHPHS